MSEKIKSLKEIQDVLEKDRRDGLKIAQCHGVFDLLHIGHIRHFKEAKKWGDKLVVSVTPDKFVNKGPGRPIFNERLRLESIAALAMVDYVVLNETADAVHPIRHIRPHVYVKGVEYKDHSTDVTGKISEEATAVQEVGGMIQYTEDLVFSSSTLLNRHFNDDPPEVTAFLQTVRKRYSLEQLLESIEALAALKVLVVGDAIIDEYQYVQALGLTGKGVHLVARCLEKEVFLGGALIIANHVAQFAKEVVILSAIGAQCPHRPFIEKTLNAHISQKFCYLQETSTLTKRRYVSKDGAVLTKLFETYSTNDPLLNADHTKSVIRYLHNHAHEYDLVLVADFGNGFTNPEIVHALSAVPAFLAINTQVNSGNRGFHVVSHYKRADFISLNESELRLAAHDRHTSIEELIVKISEKMHASAFAVTQGVQGVVSWSQKEAFCRVPALTQHSIDRIGAGDSFLAMASLCLAKGHPLSLAALMGSIAAAMGTQVIGNRDPIFKSSFCKYLTRLMK